MTFKDHIATKEPSCRFALHNIRKIRLFRIEHEAQLLVQALIISRLDYCNALLPGLPTCGIKPLQMTQNAAARLFFNESKRAHVTLCLSLRLRLSSFSRLWCLSTGQPQALHPPTSTLSYKSTCTPGACEVSEGHFMVPSQRGKKSLSLLLAGETIFPTLSRQPNL